MNEDAPQPVRVARDVCTSGWQARVLSVSQSVKLAPPQLRWAFSAVLSTPRRTRDVEVKKHALRAMKGEKSGMNARGLLERMDRLSPEAVTRKL
jgi:hypothetical protein